MEILEALAQGIQSQQSEVISIGLCGTEEIYFATNYLDADAGVMITASHNPADYNGLKIVGKGAKPVSMDSGLGEIKSIAESASYDESINYIETIEYPAVVKADGLAAGKGVIICENKDQAIAALDSIFKDQSFGEAGSSVVIEEFLEGEEASFITTGNGSELKFAQNSIVVDPWRKTPDIAGVTVIHYGNTRGK